MRALAHLAKVKALGSKEGNHIVGLGTDVSALCNSILGALGYIPALVSEMRDKGRLVDEEKGAIYELL